MSTPQADQRQVRTPLLVVLGVVVVVAVVFLGVVPLLSSGGDDAALAPLPVVPNGPEEAVPTESAPTEAPTEAPADPAAVDAVAARDPFSPLVAPTPAPDAGAAAASAATPLAPAATTPTSTAPTATAPAAQAPTAAAPAAAAPAATAPTATTQATPGPDASLDGSEVSLADVFTGPDGAPRILVAVDGVGHEGSVGATLAERFGVVAIEGTCATLSSSAGETKLCREATG